MLSNRQTKQYSRFLCVLLVLCFLISLSACSEAQPEETSPSAGGVPAEEFGTETEPAPETEVKPSFFKMSINSTSNNRGINLIAEKNCKCGVYYCFGCGKPSVYIKVLGPQNTLFGRIKLNFNCCMTLCCTHRLEIMDASNKILYIIIANNCLCPIGIECYKWGKCCNCRYLIIKGENRNSRPVGQITKISCERCCCDFLTKSDSYRIQFPSYATPVEKMMIIIAATFVDHNSFFI